MEQEFKWDADPALQERVLHWALAREAGCAKLVEMDARYFDTPDGQLAAERAALRLRREGGESVCCLKLRGADASSGLHAHEEYECGASCVAEGLSSLPEHGAPIDLCTRLRTLPLTENCRITFSRYALLLRTGGAEAELALDYGQMSADGKSAPLCEIELERKGGSEEWFLALGQALAQEFALKPQPLSKLARARAL